MILLKNCVKPLRPVYLQCCGYRTCQSLAALLTVTICESYIINYKRPEPFFEIFAQYLFVMLDCLCAVDLKTASLHFVQFQNGLILFV